MPETNGMVEVYPDPSILLAMWAKNMPWHAIASELIDNAFDQKATEVKIEFARPVRVSDDGNGCGEILKMLQLGGAIKREGGGVGVYHVGLKDCTVSIGGPIEVQSIARGKKHTGSADFGYMVRKGRWHYPHPIVTLAASGERGTILTFPNPTKNLPDTDGFQSLVKTLSFRYMPALADGRRIVLIRAGKPMMIPRWMPPPRSDIIHRTIMIEGKSVEIDVGIVSADSINPKPGLSYLYEYRVIKEAQGLGCGSYTTSLVFGTVQLRGRGWRLTTHKDDIIGHAELYTAVEAEIREVLKKAQQQAMYFQADDIASDVGRAMDAGMETMRRGVKPRERDAQKNNTGTIEQVDTGQRRTAKPKPEEETVGSIDQQIGGKIKIQWSSLPEDQGIGLADIPSARITLNLTQAPVEFAKRKSDLKEAKRLTLQMACALWAHAFCTRPATAASREEARKLRELPTPKDFPVIYAKMLKTGMDWLGAQEA